MLPSTLDMDYWYFMGIVGVIISSIKVEQVGYFIFGCSNLQERKKKRNEKKRKCLILSTLIKAFKFLALYSQSTFWACMLLLESIAPYLISLSIVNLSLHEGKRISLIWKDMYSNYNTSLSGILVSFPLAGISYLI